MDREVKQDGGANPSPATNPPAPVDLAKNAFELLANLNRVASVCHVPTEASRG